MEVVNCCKASRVSTEVGEDFISRMPEDVIANIMNCLPLRDAVGTSILSTSWRSKWTLLTQLIFDLEFFIAKRKSHFDKTNISRLLHQLKGAITKFVLHITDYMELDTEDIHHLVMVLSRIRGFKELTLINWRQTSIMLPTHLFSYLELKHLHLNSCDLSPSPYFRGFPKLLSLTLQNVRFQDHRCGEFIPQSPMLETLILDIVNRELRGEVKLVEIAKLENLNKLGLSLCLLDNMTMVRLSTALQHLSLLPKLQELYLNFGKFEFLAEDVAQNPVSTTFPFLKTLELLTMDFSSVSMLACVFGMLFGCTNLQTLHINARYKNDVSPPAIFSPEVDCSTMGQLQLRNVYLSNIKGLENEVCLMKCMLACSPMLKTIVIKSSIMSKDGNEKYKLASKLLKLHRASPMAEIIFS
uniref:F-box/FBD/LRR-repeat protein At1g13570-like n=1 Tax=Erigeron canadensis TaxID=72917 RepID=UPI001CB8F5BB|nr:F-box/FBD/LRR-repeat protein At1g13570-like [Erigeron canadensis]